MATTYGLKFIQAKKVQWQPTAHHNKPNLFIELSANEKLLYTSSTKQRNFDPRWDERVKLMTDDSSLKIRFTLYHKVWVRKYAIDPKTNTISAQNSMMTESKRLVGSTELSIGELTRRGLGQQDINLDLFNHGYRVAVLVITFACSTSTPSSKPPSPAPSPVPQPIVPSQQSNQAAPTAAESVENGFVRQTAGFSNKDIELSQLERLVQQVLARSGVAAA